MPPKKGTNTKTSGSAEADTGNKLTVEVSVSLEKMKN